MNKINWNFNNTYFGLSNSFKENINPVPVKNPELVLLNKSLASKLNLDFSNVTNKELSEELGIHPSTVSRILRSKYIDTPKGIIPLKSLLVSSVSKTRSVTPLQLMQLIDNIIKEEKTPKSDNKISLELNKKGFNLARRTITKYRNKLNIPSSRNR